MADRARHVTDGIIDIKPFSKLHGEPTNVNTDIKPLKPESSKQSNRLTSISISLLALLPLLGCINRVAIDRWLYALRIDFQWDNPDRLPYTFEAVEQSFGGTVWPNDGPSYADKDSQTCPGPAENGLFDLSPNTIAQLFVVGDTRTTDPPATEPNEPIDIWWKPDRDNTDVIRKKFTGFPKVNTKYDLKTMTVSPRYEDDKDMEGWVTEMTQFTCVNAPEKEEE